MLRNFEGRQLSYALLVWWYSTNRHFLWPETSLWTSLMCGVHCLNSKSMIFHAQENNFCDTWFLSTYLKKIIVLSSAPTELMVIILFWIMKFIETGRKWRDIVWMGWTFKNRSLQLIWSHVGQAVKAFIATSTVGCIVFLSLNMIYNLMSRAYDFCTLFKTKGFSF